MDLSNKAVKLFNGIMSSRRCNEHQRLEEIQEKLDKLNLDFLKLKTKTDQEYDSNVVLCNRRISYLRDRISTLEKRVSELLDDNEKEKVLRMMSELNEKVDATYLDFKKEIDAQSEKLEHLQKSCNDADKFNFSEYDHMMSFVYQPGRVYRVSCRTGLMTDFMFNRDERISSITDNSDSSAWEIKETTVKDICHVYVEPLSDDAATNIVVNTDKREYQLFLEADSYCNYLIVRWDYSSENSESCKHYSGGEKRERESD